MASKEYLQSLLEQAVEHPAYQMTAKGKTFCNIFALDFLTSNPDPYYKKHNNPLGHHFSYYNHSTELVTTYKNRICRTGCKKLYYYCRQSAMYNLIEELTTFDYSRLIVDKGIPILAVSLTHAAIVYDVIRTGLGLSYTFVIAQAGKVNGILPIDDSYAFGKNWMTNVRFYELPTYMGLMGLSPNVYNIVSRRK